MMADHELLCEARNGLADALKALLKAEIMTSEDFRAARVHALVAIGALERLLYPLQPAQ